MSVIDRNASAIVNGWVFQICAGVYLFLDDLKNSKSLKIEGEKEDIEIVQINKKKYIQVKCITDVKNRSSVYAHYSKALQSLKDADDGQTELIYFSNIADPFNTNESSYFDYGSCYSYEDLTKNVQTKIEAKLEKDFNYKNLKIQIVHYYGDEQTKRRLVENKISNFLSSIGENDSKKSQIYDRLVIYCFQNATNRFKKISKEEFLLNLIIPFLNQDIGIETFEKISSDEFYEECLSYYNNFLYSFDSDYQTFLKITSDYCLYRKTYLSCKSIDYINEKYIDFLFLVPSSIDKDVAMGTIKILMYRIIQKNSLLSKINKEFSL